MAKRWGVRSGGGRGANPAGWRARRAGGVDRGGGSARARESRAHALCEVGEHQLTPQLVHRGGIFHHVFRVLGHGGVVVLHRGGRTRVLATSIALEASPVARCTYCDIVEDGRPRARVVHSDAPAKGFPAIGSTETRRSRENGKNPVGKYSRRERSTDGRSPRIKILGLKARAKVRSDAPRACHFRAHVARNTHPKHTPTRSRWSRWSSPPRSSRP